MKKQNNSKLKDVLGPLFKYYENKSVHEIFIDSFQDCYFVDRNGMNSIKVFKNESEVHKLMDKILAFGKVKKSENSFNYFVQLDELAFCHIVLPPVALNGPSLSLMKLPSNEIGLDDLVKFEAIDDEGKKLLEEIVNSQHGFLVSGNVGSGKTTLMNILVNLIPVRNRVVTFEKTPDLIIKRKHVCRLQVFNNNQNEIKKIFRVGNHLRADYAVLVDPYLEEVASFIELIRNNCTGLMLLNGSSVLDSLKNLESKIVLSSDGQSFEEARDNISQSFKYIIHQEKLENGKRKITNISKIEYKDGELKLKNLYKR